MTNLYSDRARAVLARAETYANQSELEAHGAWRVLLALLDEPQSLAHKVLVGLDVDPWALRQAATHAIAVIPDDSSTVETVEEVLRAAQLPASTLKDSDIGTQDLLLGLLSLGAETSVVRFLADSGVSIARVRAEIGRFLGQYGRARSDDFAKGQTPAPALDELSSLREARRQAISDGRIDDAAHLRDLEKDLLRRMSGSSGST